MKISGTHLAFDMNCQEPILTVFREAAVLWIFLVFAASAVDTMKLTLVKGNHMTSEAGIQLPLPSTR